MNRDLFQYVEFTPSNQEMKKLIKLTQLFAKAGMDPEYIWCSTLLLIFRMTFTAQGKRRSGCRFICYRKKEELKELSRESDIVDAISGKRRTDNKLYFPADMLNDMSDHGREKEEIKRMLEWE